MRYCTFSSPTGSRPCCRRRDTCKPTANAHLAIAALAPPSPTAVWITLARTFSKMRGAPAMNVGFTSAKPIGDLVDASVDGGGEPDLQHGGEQHLAERVRERQPQELDVVDRQDLDSIDAGTLVRPARLAELDTLGPTRRP